MVRSSLKGQVFDVERFSTVDGPGIRTVAFFKGCNLRCRWCHNPEGLHAQSEVLFTRERCIGCGECFQACPRQAHVMENGRHVIDRSRCVKCFSCVRRCPAQALECSGETWNVDDLCRELLRDEDYYRHSNGGVTLTGGEVMCQADFAGAVLETLHSRGIHTALETNLSFPLEMYEKLRPFLNLLMFDVKCVDEAAHIQGTEHSNALILQNVAALAKEPWREMPLVARTPIVPQWNDTPAIIGDIAARLREHSNLLYYELLTYHPLGTEKCEKLGYAAHNKLSVPSREQMLALSMEAAKHLPHVKLDGVEITKGR